MCSVKEPNFFSHMEIAAQRLYYKKRNVHTQEEYENLFHTRPSTRLFGEASVSYLYYPKVAKRIYDYNPEAKILICLREPVRRAYSHYCMDYTLGLVKEPIATIWKNGANHPITGNHYQQYFQVGEYTEQIKCYLDVFPKNKILILLHEELCAYPEKSMSRLAAFLGLNNGDIEESLPQENVSGIAKSEFIRWLYRFQTIRKAMRVLMPGSIRERLRGTLFSRKGLPEFSDSLQRELIAHYGPMKESLHLLTGIDLTCWEKKIQVEYSESEH